MRRLTRVGVLSAIALVLSMLTITPASAEPVDNVWVADLGELNGSGTIGTAVVEVGADAVTVTVAATGASPSLPHAQHIHIGGTGECPTMDADEDDDGFVDTLEGAPFYGGVEVSLTTEGEVDADSALAVDRMPVADADEVVSYARTFELPDGVEAADLANGSVVIHGISELFDDPLAYDGTAESSLDPMLPLEATIPAACGEIEQADTTFPDVQADAYYTASVVWAWATGLTTGVGSTGEFQPMRELSRAEMVTFLWRYAGSPTGSPDHAFPDVPDNNPFYDEALDWAAAEGITDGYGDTGEFRPDLGVSRAQMVTFLWRIAGEPGGSPDHTFPDVPDNNPFYDEALDWAAAEGITTGYGNTGEFRPDVTVSRGEQVTFLYRFNLVLGGQTG